MRTCTKPGCGNKHRARGLCSTHYNREHQPTWHAPIQVACVVCGGTAMRGSKSDRRHVCSRDCWRTLVGATPGYDADQSAADRARKAGATVVVVFSVRSVFERDGWRCRMCGVLLVRDAGDFPPDMATIDHIVPLSRGGAHTVDNAQAACLHCNSAKQDRLEVASSGPRLHPLDGSVRDPRGVPLAAR
jgi:hypothetical protein